jgi:hypothetical protein
MPFLRNTPSKRPARVGGRCGVILNPVPETSPLFGSVVEEDGLVMQLDGQPRGQATVAWVAAVDRGLTKGQLDSFVRWKAGGATPTL